tara:strand:+ start:396 stop:692 length:297 start_codon:yes stop_codon:yes gene_type:complete
MRTFTVEFTSENWGQVDVQASTPGEAVAEALRARSSLEGALCDMIESCDPKEPTNGQYRGWSRIVISLDGQYNENGKWRREGDPPPTDMELLAEADNG